MPIVYIDFIVDQEQYFSVESYQVINKQLLADE